MAYIGDTPLTIKVTDTHKSYCPKMDMYHYKIDTTKCSYSHLTGE